MDKINTSAICNFSMIEKLMKFEDENDFYFIQILQRKKDNKEMKGSTVKLKSYYIYDLQQFQDKMLEIIQICEYFCARAYIHLIPRNAKIIALEMLELLAHNIKCNQYQGLYKLYNTICGRYIPKKNKSWIIDIDEHSNEKLTEIINLLFLINPLGNKIIAKIPTKNGIHLITSPFNRKIFKEKYQDIEIHTNNPTILYIPSENKQ